MPALQRAEETSLKISPAVILLTFRSRLDARSCRDASVPFQYVDIVFNASTLKPADLVHFDTGKGASSIFYGYGPSIIYGVFAIPITVTRTQVVMNAQTSYKP
ncbi:hypothetical protein EVAR_69122_1 [Eumeta japonica]|uniref:Uncharacterized protein n=1 Tax=Eumeta variegata TaxID=151549 RepID=A0A4C1SCR3_EUMVA|nr:hypothetical protein EVAR_69122_1 [Eumeta japonica]